MAALFDALLRIVFSGGGWWCVPSLTRSSLPCMSTTPSFSLFVPSDVPAVRLRDLASGVGVVNFSCFVLFVSHEI